MSELPNGWEWVAFKDVIDINPRTVVNLPATDNVSFVPMTSVSETSGTIVEHALRALQEVSTGYKQFAENDVVLAKITPSMENGKAAVAIGLGKRRRVRFD